MKNRESKEAGSKVFRKQDNRIMKTLRSKSRDHNFFGPSSRRSISAGSQDRRVCHSPGRRIMIYS